MHACYWIYHKETESTQRTHKSTSPAVMTTWADDSVSDKGDGRPPGISRQAF